MKLHRYVDHQRLHIVTKDVISLSILVLLLFRHYISHKITFGAPSSGGVLCSACGAFICCLIRNCMHSAGPKGGPEGHVPPPRGCECPKKLSWGFYFTPNFFLLTRLKFYKNTPRGRRKSEFGFRKKIRRSPLIRCTGLVKNVRVVDNTYPTAVGVISFSYRPIRRSDSDSFLIDRAILRLCKFKKHVVDKHKLILMFLSV